MADMGLDSQGDRWGMEEEIDYGEDPFEMPETPMAEQPAGEEKVVKAAGGRTVLAGSKIDLSGKGEVRSRRDRGDDGRRDREYVGRDGKKEGERTGGERKETERREDERRDGDRERKHRHKHRSRREDHASQGEVCALSEEIASFLPFQFSFPFCFPFYFRPIASPYIVLSLAFYYCNFSLQSFTLYHVEGDCLVCTLCGADFGNLACAACREYPCL